MRGVNNWSRSDAGDEGMFTIIATAAIVLAAVTVLLTVRDRRPA